MNQRALVAAAAASLLSTLLVATPAAAQEKEKCYGIAKAGQNDCANLAGTHSCAGQSKLSDDVGEWKYVAKGTCAGMKGLTAMQAKEKTMMKGDTMKKDGMMKKDDMQKKS
jgi:uncharacterized membrane protein